jgi:hypothetical protein
MAPHQENIIFGIMESEITNALIAQAQLMSRY